MINQKCVESFLREVDGEFPIPLSSKVDISALDEAVIDKIIIPSGRLV